MEEKGFCLGEDLDPKATSDSHRGALTQQAKISSSGRESRRHRKGLFWDKERRRLIDDRRKASDPQKDVDSIVDRIMGDLRDLLKESQERKKESENEKEKIKECRWEILEPNQLLYKRDVLLVLLKADCIALICHMITSNLSESGFASDANLVAQCLNLLSHIFGAAYHHEVSVRLLAEGESSSDSISNSSTKEKEGEQQLHQEFGIKKEFITLLLNLLRAPENEPKVLQHACMVLVSLAVPRNISVWQELVDEKLPLLLVLLLSRLQSASEADNAVRVAALSVIPSLCTPGYKLPPAKSLYPLFPSVPKLVESKDTQVCIACCDAVLALILPDTVISNDTIHKELTYRLLNGCPDFVNSTIELIPRHGALGKAALEIVLHLLGHSNVLISSCGEKLFWMLCEEKEMAGTNQRKLDLLLDCLVRLFAPGSAEAPAFASKFLESGMLPKLMTNGGLPMKRLAVMVPLMESAGPACIKKYVDPNLWARWLRSFMSPVGSQKDPADMLSMVLACIETVLSAEKQFEPAGRTPFVRTFVEALEEAEMLDQIENLQTHENATVYEHAVRILEKYFSSEEDFDYPSYDAPPNAGGKGFMF